MEDQLKKSFYYSFSNAIYNSGVPVFQIAVRFINIRIAFRTQGEVSVIFSKFQVIIKHFFLAEGYTI